MAATIAQALIAVGSIVGVLWSFYAKEKKEDKRLTELETKVAQMVTIATCQTQHERNTKDMAEVKNTLKDVVESLQGKPGETGLVSELRSMGETLRAIRRHQQNGG